MGLRIEVLGPVRVRAGREIGLSRSSHRRLLSILALDAPRRIATDVLIDRFWGEQPPATAKAVVQTYVSGLRKLLPADVIVTEGYGYRLDLTGHVLDADDFAALAADARQAVHARRWEHALDSAEAALAFWRGAPYGELRDDDFARGEIARIEELRLELEETRAEALLGLGQARDALPELERLVREHPLRERLWQHLMTARYRLGRHAEALEAYREAWKALAELGLEPSGSLRRLEQKILLHDQSVRQAETPNNLPVELTDFVGRDRELADVADLVTRHRLVTLTGVGGSGKTRLAAEVARTVLARFPDGCWLVELASVREAAHVAAEVAAAVGLRPQGEDILAALFRALGEDTALVVLDNCEHLPEATAAVARALLEAGHELTILATSRQPLRVPGEVVYDVPPMSFPDDDHAVEELGAFDAIELFDARARLARPSFALDPTTAADVARICRRLDGIPLAIELAAARVGSLRPATIADRLDNRFRLLTGGSSTGPERHQTLEAAFAWSFDLLERDERLLFPRLGVFRGGFTLEMAEDVCSGEGIERADVVPLVSALVEKSLVSTYGDERRVRYRLLETVREYALARLEELGEPAALRARHLDWSVRFADDVNANVYGAGRSALFQRLATESDNLQAALEWSLAEGLGAATRMLARALAWHWWDEGHLGLVVSTLTTALEHGTDALEEAEIRTLVCAAHDSAGDVDAASAESARAYELVAGLPPSLPKVWVLQRHATQPLLVDRDPGPALPLARAALDEALSLGDPVAEIRVRRALGWALAWNGDVRAGTDQYRAALELALELDDPTTALDTYEFFFDVLYLDAEARRSEPRRNAEELLARFGDLWTTNAYRWWLAYVFLQTGEWERAEEIVARLGDRHLEGYDRAAYLITHATLRWMQGRLDDAREDLDQLAEIGVNRRWYHYSYPLLAEVGADWSRLDDVRSAADAYLAVPMHRSHESKKVAVLTPLVRAEVDAALATSGEERAAHVERARAAVSEARGIVETFPPKTEGSVQLETPRTSLALAEAELSRVVRPDPSRWRDAVSRADFVYVRLYARWRLAEALYESGAEAEARRELDAALAHAARLGAERIRRELEALATRMPTTRRGGAAARAAPRS